jgi:hypothetical protein
MPINKLSDHSLALDAELAKIKSLGDFCSEWKEKWRPIAVAAQGILSFLFPPGAKVLGFLISIADSACPSM